MSPLLPRCIGSLAISEARFGIGFPIDTHFKMDIPGRGSKANKKNLFYRSTFPYLIHFVSMMTENFIRKQNKPKTRQILLSPILTAENSTCDTYT